MLRSTTVARRHLLHHHPRILSPIPAYHLRPTSHNGPPSTRRHFSSTDITTPLLDTTTSFIISLHSTTGLPWLLTIPLIAFLIRTTITLPFTIYAHKRQQVQLSLSPLLHAHTYVFRRKVAQESLQSDPTKKVYDTPEKWQKEVLKRVARKRRELYRTFGCQVWKGFMGLVQLPVWIAASVSVRTLTGVGGGLWMRGGGGEGAAAATAAVAVAAEDAFVEDAFVEDVTVDAVHVVDELAAVGTEGGSTIPDEVTLQIREEMRLEGIDGWFTDLLLPDPYFILPIVFSLTMFTNAATMGMRRTRPDEPPTPLTGWRKGLRTGLMAMSILAFPFTVNTPVVLLLYWITSSAYSLAQNAVIPHILPMPRKVKPVVKKSGVSWIE